MRPEVHQAVFFSLSYNSWFRRIKDTRGRSHINLSLLLDLSSHSLIHQESQNICWLTRRNIRIRLRPIFLHLYLLFCFDPFSFSELFGYFFLFIWTSNIFYLSRIAEYIIIVKFKCYLSDGCRLYSLLNVYSIKNSKLHTVTLCVICEAYPDSTLEVGRWKKLWKTIHGRSVYYFSKFILLPRIKRGCIKKYK